MLTGGSLLCASGFPQRFWLGAFLREDSARLPHGKGETVTQRVWCKCFIKEGMHFQKSFGSYKAGVYEVQEHSHWRIQDEILSLKILQTLRVTISC